MKKITLLFWVVLCICSILSVSVKATDTLTIYQNGFVTARIPVSTIDSMNFNRPLGVMSRDEFLNSPTTIQSHLVNWDFMGTGAHDSFGMMAILHATDMMTEDIVMSKLSHFRYDYYLDNRNFNFRRPIMVWGYLHDIILKSNRIIQVAPSNITSDELRFTLGQAYAMRAYAYYYLVQLFQHTGYIQNPANLNLPTIPLIYATREGKPNKLYRVPAAEVLAQIESDLLKSKELLEGLSRQEHSYAYSNLHPKSNIDINVVNGLLARYYLLTGKWEQAVTAARAAQQGYNIVDQSNYRDGFMLIYNPEWMWGFMHNEQTTSIYASFFSHISNLSPGYAGLDYAPRLIDKRLYDQIPSTDIRKTMYQDEAGSLTPNTYADQSATAWRLPYANLKFGFQHGFVQDYVYMRVSEMVLIEAEALAHQQGKSGEAAIALKKLMQNRDNSWDKTSVTVEDVLLQRRIELWGEGFAYFDLKRLSKGIDRTYPESNHEAGAKIVVPADDIRWYYQIPQNALDAYPGINNSPVQPTTPAPIIHIESDDHVNNHGLHKNQERILKLQINKQ